MKTYDNYKDSGIQWIGKIPEHWEVSRFKFWADYQKGKMPSAIEFEAPTNCPIYLSMDYLRGTNNQTQYAVKNEGCTLVEDSEILLLWDGSNAGEFIQGKKGVLSSTMVKIIPNENLTNNYCWFELKAFEFDLKSATYGMGIPHVNSEFLKNSFHLLPPLSEQTAIANYLDSKITEIDQVVADKEALVGLYEEEKKALINEAITKGLNPEVKLKLSGIDWLGYVPEHWEVKKLKYLVEGKLMYGANEVAEFDNVDFPRYIRITDFGDNGTLKDETFKSLPFDIAKDYFLTEGDILFARSGATVGKTFQFKAYQGRACFAGYLIKATPNKGIILSDWLYYFTKSDLYENWKNSIFNQATIQNIGADKYNLLVVPICKLEEQTAIVQYIESGTVNINDKINQIKQEIALLKEYRQTLIFEVVTGKLRVHN